MKFQELVTAFSFAVAASVLVAPATAAGPNLIVNGSFEQPVTGNFSTFAKDSSQIPGWTITLGTVDVIGPNWHAYSGKQSLDLDGTPGPGAISQTFPTVPGSRYTLTFALASNPECLPAQKRLRVTVAGITRFYSFDTAHASDSAMGWRLITIPFITGAAQTTLAFLSLDPAGSNCGPALDAISVVSGYPSGGSSGGGNPGGGNPGGGNPGGKPCYVNAGAYAKIGPCAGPSATVLTVTLLRKMHSAPARLRFDRVLVNGVPGVVLLRLSGAGTGAGARYTTPADRRLCMGPGFPKRWDVTLIDASGVRQGDIGSFTMTGCP